VGQWQLTFQLQMHFAQMDAAKDPLLLDGWMDRVAGTFL
jgi:hypothetical protein